MSPLSKPPVSYFDSMSIDKAVLAKHQMSSSVSIANRIKMVGIKPLIDDNGIVYYKIYIEYIPDSRFSEASLEGKITLAGIIDSSEYRVQDGFGVWEASYEERWEGAYTVKIIDDATAEEKKIDFSVVYYTNPMSAIHSLMSQDVLSFYDMEKDDLGNIPEIVNNLNSSQ